MKLSRPAFWDRCSLISSLLWPLSLAYRGLTLLHRKMVKPIDTQCFIICIGNAVIGGAGKTPTAIAVMQLMQNHKSCFLSKNYKGLKTQAHLITDQDQYPDIGDEALLLSRHAPTIIARDRREGIGLAEQLGFEIIVMDDGYQNPSIRPDYRILVHGGEGNQKLLPAGPLRQTVAEAQQWADAIIDTPQTEIVEPAPDKTLNYTAFCGLGRPEKFFRTLTDHGYTLRASHEFPDHHPFTVDELTALGDDPLITTEKDWMRLPPSWQERVHVLKIRALLPKTLEQELLKNINNVSRETNKVQN